MVRNTRVRELKHWVAALLKRNPDMVMTRRSWRALKRDWMRRRRQRVSAPTQVALKRINAAERGHA